MVTVKSGAEAVAQDSHEPSAQYYLKKFAELDNLLKFSKERAQVKYLVSDLPPVKLEES